MTATVRIEPGGHEFLVERNETILDAALRSGLSLDYGCKSGTCGECKGQIVSGETRDIKFCDYVLTNADKAANSVLLCSATAETDLVIEAHAIMDVKELPHQERVVKIGKLERLGEHIGALHLKTQRTQPLRFFAGQYITLHIPGIGARNKSIASCPCNGTNLQIHIREIPGDEFSDCIFNDLGKSGSIDIEGPYGAFVLHSDSTHPLIMLAYDTGFAPVKSLVEDAIALDLRQPIHLYWVVPEQGGHYMENYCRSWVDALDDFKYTPLVCSLESTECQISGAEQGPQVDSSVSDEDMAKAANVIIEDYPDMSEHDVYISGPPTMVKRAKAAFIAHGLHESQFYVDDLPHF